MLQKPITFADDFLERETYADFLIKVVRKGQSDEGSFTLAIDAKYGSGKTWFLKMLEHKINTECISDDIPLVAVRYDAWKYDYFDDPLAPLVEQIMKSEAFIDETAVRNAKSALGKAAAGVKALAKSDWSEMMEDGPGWAKGVAIGLEAMDAIRSGEPAASGDVRGLRRYQSALDDLQKALDKVARPNSAVNSRLLVIVDELDRCRPDFAIRTLEVTKHLLTSESVVFLYAVDMEQLGRAAEMLYGAGMDHQSYLLKFFHYVSVLPSFGKTDYLLHKLSRFLDAYYCNPILSEMNYRGRIGQQSYRDIDRIVSAFKLMEELFLQEYMNPNAHLLYFYLLYLKYVNRDAFNRLVSNIPDRETMDKGNEMSVDNKLLSGSLNSMLSRDRIVCDPEKGYMSIVSAITGKEKWRISQNVMNDEVTYYVSNPSEINDRPRLLAPGSYVCPAIYYPDVKRIMDGEELNIALPQYIHRQLEMYGL